SFEDIKIAGEENKNEKAKYKISSFTHMLDEIDYRFIVVHSTAVFVKRKVALPMNDLIIEKK
ncbi:MAG: hypothetical protein ACLKAK_01525, partial [Alkaliphilus sp.]